LAIHLVFRLSSRGTRELPSMQQIPPKVGMTSIRNWMAIERNMLGRTMLIIDVHPMI
jgi:hypothetical protein